MLTLLASHNAAAGGFVQDRIKSAVLSFLETKPELVPPARVGPYRLVRELGRGGMGTVFLAERDDDQYQAKVAIKLVRPGMDTDFILTRFRRERQTLARLNHHNIGRLLDGGSHSGLPYIVMEYIDGPYLTVYARNHKLGIQDRVNLFLHVCSAVDYAHRNFVIHLDLKPSNILVDREGTPKLLDFGICKLLRDDAACESETESPLTPNYGSPEQIDGGSLSLLSDVYSLGVVLHELLTESLPVPIAKLGSHVAKQSARGGAIALPSTLVQDRPAARRIAGDLDCILMHALQKDPDRRYESAAVLADDLRRYLSEEPIHARTTSMAYRALKFTRRHRVAVPAAALTSVSLAPGAAISAHASRITRSTLEQIRALSRKLIFDVDDAVRDLPGSVHARQLIISAGLAYLDAAAKPVKGDLRAQKDISREYRQLGDRQREVPSATPQDLYAARTSYRKALDLLDDVLIRFPGDQDVQSERLLLYQRLAEIQSLHPNHWVTSASVKSEKHRTNTPVAHSTGAEPNPSDGKQPVISPYTMMMTREQQRLVRDSFDSLEELAQPFALLFYGKLFELDPGARRLFHNDLSVQGCKLLATLGSVLESLDDFEPMGAQLAELGRKHAEYGVRPEQYDILATALLWSLGQALGPNFDAPTREAWALTVNELNSAMKAGVAGSDRLDR